jgi:hypothetical protein
MPFWEIPLTMLGGAAMGGLFGGGGDSDRYEDERRRLLQIQGDMAQMSHDAMKSRMGVQQDYMTPALQAANLEMQRAQGTERPMMWGRGVFEPRFQQEQQYTPPPIDFNPTTDLPVEAPQLPPGGDPSTRPVRPPPGGGGRWPGFPDPPGVPDVSEAAQYVWEMMQSLPGEVVNVIREGGEGLTQLPPYILDFLETAGREVGGGISEGAQYAADLASRVPGTLGEGAQYAADLAGRVPGGISEGAQYAADLAGRVPGAVGEGAQYAADLAGRVPGELSDAAQYAASLAGRVPEGISEGAAYAADLARAAPGTIVDAAGRVVELPADIAQWLSQLDLGMGNPIPDFDLNLQDKARRAAELARRGGAEAAKYAEGEFESRANVENPVTGLSPSDRMEYGKGRFGQYTPPEMDGGEIFMDEQARRRGGNLKGIDYAGSLATTLLGKTGLDKYIPKSLNPFAKPDYMPDAEFEMLQKQAEDITPDFVDWLLNDYGAVGKGQSPPFRPLIDTATGDLLGYTYKGEVMDDELWGRLMAKYDERPARTSGSGPGWEYLAQANEPPPDMSPSDLSPGKQKAKSRQRRR